MDDGSSSLTLNYIVVLHYCDVHFCSAKIMLLTFDFGCLVIYTGMILMLCRFDNKENTGFHLYIRLDNTMCSRFTMLNKSFEPN